jgi:aspartyl-tRNA(Asn)/glutamyl-tRNA(Gln) amidotransferase subunit A
VFPLSYSLDHVGPLCRSVSDTALLLQAIAGYDKRDATCVDWPVDSYTVNIDVRPRIGIVRRPYFDDLNHEVASSIDEALKQIGNMATDVFDVELPAMPAAVQGPEVHAVHAKYFGTSPELYGRWIQERLKQAAKIDAVAYVEARQQLDQVRRRIEDVFAEVDFLITPTTPVPPITIKEGLNMSPDPAGELWLRNTRPFNAYGLPTISIPCGFTRTGLPIGLQIAGPRFGEARLLSFAFAFERAAWHQRTPPCVKPL